MSNIYLDDPDAIERLEVKLAKLETEKAHWKKIPKTKPRPYDSSDGDKRWWIVDNLTANIRSVKKKIEKIQNLKDANISLERKTTFKNGRKVFYYAKVEEGGN